MEYQTFTRAVALRSGLPVEMGALIGHDVLRVLAERIGGRTARDLAERLPRPFRDSMCPIPEEGGSFGVDEFVLRVAVRSGAEHEDARAGSAAVLSTLADAVEPDVFDRVLSRLSSGYRELVGLTGSRPRGLVGGTDVTAPAPVPPPGGERVPVGWSGPAMATASADSGPPPR